MEYWRDIKDFEGYQVSDLGRVRTHNKTTANSLSPCRVWKDRILKQKDSCKDGRLRVALWKDNKSHTLLVHRLQAIAFLGEPPMADMTVNHKDGNPKNNVPSNLEWVTRAENIRYGFENGQYSTSHNVILVDDIGRRNEFRSKSEASRWLGRNVGYISTQLRGGSRQANSINGEHFSISI